MHLSNDLLLKILGSVSVSDDESGTMHIIVQRNYDYLMNDLGEVFWDKEDVELKIDVREEERRRENRAFPQDRRQNDRRKEKVTLVEVVITT